MTPFTTKTLEDALTSKLMIHFGKTAEELIALAILPFARFKKKHQHLPLRIIAQREK